MESVYNIKQVPTCEVNKLVHFINMHWKHNHSLAVSRELLNFQHLDKDKDCYNFLVAENKETGEYDALIGSFRLRNMIRIWLEMAIIGERYGKYEMIFITRS